ncbi:MAG: cytidylyltransferase domain-containing protein [Candidatus Nanopelagicales bacterium]
MKTVAFIFARSGSKGLPNKNIKLFAGKPLIAHSIEQALSVKRIERVIVSTDSEEIAQISLHYGAEVPYLRPVELAQDESPELLSWRHGLEFLENSTGSLPQVMISLPPTAPLRLPKDIENCLDEFQKKEADVVITVTNSHRNPYFNMVKSNENGSFELVNRTQTKIIRRQDAPQIYDVTTLCYVARPEFVMTHDSIFDGKVKAVVVPNQRSIDIDSLLDFEIAEFLFYKQRESV